MVTLRCTQKLLRRLRQPLKPEAQPPTTVLGDWYATLIHSRPEQIVLGMNERSMLVTIVTARDGKHLPDRFRERALDQLLRIGVPPALVGREALEMREFHYGPTVNRSVVGCMNDVLRALPRVYERHRTDEAVEEQFWDWIFSPLGSRRPREVALHLFGVVPERIEHLEYYHGMFDAVGLARASRADVHVVLDGDGIPEHLHRLFVRERIVELSGTYGTSSRGRVEVDYLRLKAEGRTWEIRVANRAVSMLASETSEVTRLHRFLAAVWVFARETNQPG